MSLSLKYIEENKDAIIALAQQLRSNPEYGFFEFKSSEIVKKAWEGIGLEVEGPFGRTGLVAKIEGSCKGPTVAVIGELDAVGSPNNKYADKDGVAHACGHFMQNTQVFACACALLKQQDLLCGTVVLMAVPSEEFLQMEERVALKQAGEICYFSGKEEFVKLGLFDHVDMAVMIHAEPVQSNKLLLNCDSLGFTAKRIRFAGKASHVVTPEHGVNALEAATLFLNGINSNRSTFTEGEKMRIHPIITRGGSVVNTVPDDVRIETYVRGASSEAIKKGCEVVDRCAQGAALMMGCKVEIETIPGYLPLKHNPRLNRIMEEVGVQVLGEGNTEYGTGVMITTDMGDISNIMPAIQPTLGGFTGALHSAEFDVCDLWTTASLGGEILSQFVIELLKDGAGKANAVLENYQSLLSREQYLDYLENK